MKYFTVMESPSRAECEGLIEKMCLSLVFANKPQIRKALRYVSNATLNGEQITEEHIIQFVLDRTDKAAIASAKENGHARGVMLTLRRCLAEYYAEHQGERVQMVCEPKEYNPRFRYREVAMGPEPVTGKEVSARQPQREGIWFKAKVNTGVGKESIREAVEVVKEKFRAIRAEAETVSSEETDADIRSLVWVVLKVGIGTVLMCAAMVAAFGAREKRPTHAQ